MISMGFAILVMGFNWKSAIFAVILFGLFLLYLHSGWFRIDPSHPLTPIRRDPRGQDIQRKALIASIVMGLLGYVIMTQLAISLGLSLPTGQIALSMGMITYFVTQLVLLARA
jgi:hypothetical protein